PGSDFRRWVWITIAPFVTVVGIYAQRVISQGIAAVPLLNKFNSQVSSVLSGVIVTAVPLAAIYTFEQNKSKLVLKFVGPK
ncbi:hypothetical protein ACGI2S_24130, partial [Escherichia coli]